MNTRRSYIIALFFIVVVVAFLLFRKDQAPIQEDQMPIQKDQRAIDPENPPFGFADAGPLQIDSIEFLVENVDDLMWDVLLRGSFPDSCTSIGPYQQRMDGITLFVDIIAKRPAEVLCAQALTPFEEVFSFEVFGDENSNQFIGVLSDVGEYFIDINGHQRHFILQDFQ